MFPDHSYRVCILISQRFPVLFAFIVPASVERGLYIISFQRQGADDCYLETAAVSRRKGLRHGRSGEATIVMGDQKG